MQTTTAAQQTRPRQRANQPAGKNAERTFASPGAPLKASASETRCACGGGCPRCASKNSGEPLSSELRDSLETSYNADLAGVRVHTNSSAHEIARAERANAVTSGSDIYFARDRYAPHTEDGWRRVAHEVAHVVQQRNGRASGPATYASAETEAWQSATQAHAGRRATISQQSGGLLQHDDDKAAPSAPDATPATPAAPDYQLHLDPEIQRMALQYYIRWYVGTSLTAGTPSAAPTDAPAASAPAAAPSTNATSPAADAPAADAPAAAPAGLPAALAPWRYQIPLQPNFYEPIDPTVIHPDMSALMAPYNNRNVPSGARDVDAATAIFQRNYQFVTGLPDLRSMAPSFIRPLIPSTWRKSLAESFTAATMNAQLKSDYPTAIEAADRSFERITGVSTTYIPIPGFSF